MQTVFLKIARVHQPVYLNQTAGIDKTLHYFGEAGRANANLIARPDIFELRVDMRAKRDVTFKKYPTPGS